MKTFKHLYERICTFENLELAFRKARRGKRGRPDVAAFELDLDIELLALQEELSAESYQPGRYRHFTIYEGKPRRTLAPALRSGASAGVSAAPFRDRVVHHALCNVIEPIWEARFIHDSYACRAGKGTHAALDRCTHFARRYPYVLQADVVQFFPSVDHATLRGLLAHYIADPPTMTLIDRIIASGAGIHAAGYEMQWFPGDDLLAAARPRGLPTPALAPKRSAGASVGNQTSQFWANVYLNELDQFVKGTLRCPAYVRYCDDLLLFASDKPTLHRWRREIEEHLVSLRLKIHEAKTAVHPVGTGIPFLGFRVYPDHRRLARANGVRFGRRLRPLLRRYAAGEIDLARVHASVHGWIGHAAHGDTWGLRRRVLSRTVVPRQSRPRAVTAVP